MSLIELVVAMQQQATRLKKEESELLRDIAAAAGIETAEAAKEYFDHTKHAYSIEGYVYKLQKLINLLVAGIQNETAFKLAESYIDTDVILQIYRQEIVVKD